LKKIALFTLLYCFSFVAYSQCSNNGQTPSSAFPVCGNTQFIQSTVPLCPGRQITSLCGGSQYTDINPYWYQFTCFKAGLFSFAITPNDLRDDYDWQLFDITGRNPNDVYDDASLIVAANWSGNPGVTGASSQGTTLNNCEGRGFPTISSMPSLLEGHTYLLLISHFTDSQSGYTLNFNTDTKSKAVIADPVIPDLKSAFADCDGQNIFLVLNKKMKQSSLALDGSDFTIPGSTVNIVSAKAISTNGFQMDTVQLILDKPLPIGDYTVIINKGSDQNTLLDNCDVSTAEGKTASFKIEQQAPTLIKDMKQVTCKPDLLELHFEKAILCNSFASDGSDFIITGPSPVSVSGASGTCNNGKTLTISIQLQNPIIVEGEYKVTIKKGTDGNTLIDKCTQETPENNSITFQVKSPVDANFTYESTFDCKENIFQFQQTNNAAVTLWNWDIDGKKFNVQNPKVTFTDFEKKIVTLTVSNEFCTDTKSQTIILDNELKADFETNNTICPEDSAVFKNKSIGQIISWNWNFDNGYISTQKDPMAQKYPIVFAEKDYTITLTVNSINCSSTISQKIKVLNSCYIAVPTAFTPNRDGLNDFLYPANAFKAKNLKFKVYNSWGQLVFSSTDWTQKWDGTIKGNPQQAGVYVWTLEYTHEDSGKFISQKGYTVLIR
jgi:gliding motility-associated-like protein